MVTGLATGFRGYTAAQDIFYQIKPGDESTSARMTPKERRDHSFAVLPAEKSDNSSRSGNPGIRGYTGPASAG
jgi:hypothetical protein